MTKKIKYSLKIHFFLALPVGFIVIISCLTGAILVFENELTELIYRKRYFVETDRYVLPLDRLLPMINMQLDNNRVASIKLFDNEKRCYIASLENGFKTNAYINQYTGEIIEVSSYSENFFFKVMSIHRWLGDTGKTWGKMIIGFCSICFVILIITGILLWLPKNKQQFKKALRIRTGKGLRAFIFDIHAVGGTYISLILLVITLTGLMWLFKWYRAGVNTILRIQEVPKNVNRVSNNASEVNFKAWQSALDHIKKFKPCFNIITINNGTASVLIKNMPHDRASDKLVFDKQTGTILSDTPYNKLTWSERAGSWFFYIHVGAWCGKLSKVLYLIVVLLGACLPISGYYLVYRKYLRKNHRVGE